MPRNLFNINMRIHNKSSQYQFFLEAYISPDNLEFSLIFIRMIHYRFQKSCPPLVPISNLMNAVHIIIIIIIIHFKPHINFFLPSIPALPIFLFSSEKYIYVSPTCVLYVPSTHLPWFDHPGSVCRRTSYEAHCTLIFQTQEFFIPSILLNDPFSAPLPCPFLKRHRTNCVHGKFQYSKQYWQHASTKLWGKNFFFPIQICKWSLMYHNTNVYLSWIYPYGSGYFVLFLLKFGLYTPSWGWHRCPEIGTSSIDWDQLSRFYLKMETESSLRNTVFWKINKTVFSDEDRTMENVQKHNICSNVPSSQTFRFVLLKSQVYLRNFERGRHYPNDNEVGWRSEGSGPSCGWRKWRKSRYIRRSHSVDYEEYVLLGFDAVYVGDSYVSEEHITSIFMSDL
jgi:hypothetical protein